MMSDFYNIRNGKVQVTYDASGQRELECAGLSSSRKLSKAEALLLQRDLHHLTITCSFSHHGTLPKIGAPSSNENYQTQSVGLTTCRNAARTCGAGESGSVANSVFLMFSIRILVINSPKMDTEPGRRATLY
jgi:hypothetical protein